MTTIKATIHNGNLQLAGPLNLPEGAEVELTIHVLPTGNTLRGMTEEEQGYTPEAIARWIQMVEAAPVPIISDEAFEAMEQRRRADRELQRKNALEREKRLQSHLE